MRTQIISAPAVVLLIDFWASGVIAEKKIPSA
jgi:hypothetical protein